MQDVGLGAGVHADAGEAVSGEVQDPEDDENADDNDSNLCWNKVLLSSTSKICFALQSSVGFLLFSEITDYRNDLISTDVTLQPPQEKEKIEVAVENNDKVGIHHDLVERHELIVRLLKVRPRIHAALVQNEIEILSSS